MCRLSMGTRRETGRFTSVVLLLVFVLTGCNGDSSETTASGTSENAEVEQVLADYRVAWAEHDVDGFFDIVTDDFTLIEFIYQQVGDEFDFDTTNSGKEAAPKMVEDHA